MRGFILSGLLIFVLPAPAASAGEGRQAATPFWKDVLSELVRDALPAEYEEKPGWGDTTRITVGAKIDTHDWKIDIEKRKKRVNHGLWKHYRVRLIDPARRLKVEIKDLHWAGPGRLAFQARLLARLEAFARHSRWQRGIRTYSISAEAEATVELRLDCEVTLNVRSEGYFLAVALEPEIKDVDIRLRDFDLHRVSKVGGWVADELGDGLRDTIAGKLNRREPRLAEKLNRSINKRRDRLTLSPGDVWQMMNDER